MQAKAGGEVAEVVIFSVLPDTCAPPEDAHDAYVKAANELFGEFASAPPETDILAVLSDAYAQPTVLASIMPVGRLAMAKKKTPEEIAEENTRTNEVGLFNFADSYLLCAKELLKKRPPPPRPAPWRFDDPIHFLLFHAAELYLKSYLRQKGEDVAALKDLGHYHARICEKAATFGLNLSSEIRDIFELLDQNDAVIESRYIVTGWTKRIENQKLLTIVEEVRANVKASHEGAGVKLGATSALP